MIMVVVDWLAKAMVAILTTSTITMDKVARLFQNNVCSRYGLPRTIISNQGPQFVSQFMRDLLKLLGIKGNPSTAYHPQTDGQKAVES
jgi:transposase InsO family protein